LVALPDVRHGTRMHGLQGIDHGLFRAVADGAGASRAVESGGCGLPGMPCRGMVIAA
jgi:hypothetical protein